MKKYMLQDDRQASLVSISKSTNPDVLFVVSSEGLGA